MNGRRKIISRDPLVVRDDKPSIWRVIIGVPVFLLFVAFTAYSCGLWP